MYNKAKYEHEWKVIADRQYKQSIQRQKQQKQYQNQLKQKYLQQLSQQIKFKQKAIQHQKSLQKHIDKLQVSRSIQNQKRMIEIQKLKQSMIQDKTNQIENQNLLYERKKKQKENQIKYIEKTLEQIKNQQNQQLMQYQKQQEQRKKQYFRNMLLQSIQEKNQIKKEEKSMQKQIQIQKLHEFQTIQQRNDYQRMKQLQRLRERAKKVDYGSHSLFQQNKNKSLRQKKQQQWQIYKDSIERQQQLKRMQQEQRMGRKMMLNYYQRQLKNQITEKEENQKIFKIEEQQKDKILVKQSEMFKEMIESQQKGIEYVKKKQLYGFLKEQEERKRNQIAMERAMKQQQLKFNKSTLLNDGEKEKIDKFNVREYDKGRSHSTLDPQPSDSTSIMGPGHYKPTPGDTFRLDPARVRHYQILNRSLKSLPDDKPPMSISIDLNNSRNHRYFASKALNVLY